MRRNDHGKIFEAPYRNEGEGILAYMERTRIAEELFYAPAKSKTMDLVGLRTMIKQVNTPQSRWAHQY